MTQSSFLRAQEDGAKYLAGNALVCSDNLDVLQALPDECVDLIYLDPPFQSATHYVAIFGDKGQVGPTSSRTSGSGLRRLSEPSLVGSLSALNC